MFFLRPFNEPIWSFKIVQWSLKICEFLLKRLLTAVSFAYYLKIGGLSKLLNGSSSQTLKKLGSSNNRFPFIALTSIWFAAQCAIFFSYRVQHIGAHRLVPSVQFFHYGIFLFVIFSAIRIALGVLKYKVFIQSLYHFCYSSLRKNEKT